MGLKVRGHLQKGSEMGTGLIIKHTNKKKDAIVFTAQVDRLSCLIILPTFCTDELH